MPLSSALLALASLSVSALATAATVAYTNPSCSSFVVSGTPPNQTVTCAGSPQLGTVTYSGSSCTSFAVTGVPPNQILTCVSGGGVPVCTLTASPPAPATGQSATITANCSNQPFPNGYVWSGGCPGNLTSTCTVTKSKPITVIFNVKATNGAGAGVPGQLSVSWK